MAKTAKAQTPALRTLVLINRRSGTVRTRGPEAVQALVAERLANRFPDLTVELVDGDVAARAAEALKEKSHNLIIAGGGDGSITSVASLLVGRDEVLGALPLGTMNLIVQALGFSPKLEEALEQFATASVEKIDIGLANDRHFLHQVSFGIQPRMARLREKLGYGSRLTKMVNAARAYLMLSLRPKLVRVNVRVDEDELRISAPLVAITNNPIGSSSKWSVQHRLDQGVLGYYAVSDMSPLAVVRLARDYMRDRLHDNDAFDSRHAKAVSIKRRPRLKGRAFDRLKKRKGILASLDGEVAVLENPVNITLLPASVNVLALRPANAGTSAQRTAP